MITCERFTMYLWVNRRCISLMTVQTLTALTKKNDMLCSLSRAAMNSNLSRFSRRSTTLSYKTCASSARAGSVCFTARTAIHSKTVCVKMT